MSATTSNSVAGASAATATGPPVARPEDRRSALPAIAAILEKDSQVTRNEMHVWEQALDKTWDKISDSISATVDPSSLLASARARKAASDARCDSAQADRDAVVQKGLLRNLVIVLDLSRFSDAKDLRPTRRAVTLSAAEGLVREFFDQNPVSSLAVVAAYDLRALRLAPLSGSPGAHVSALRALSRHGGDFSLQNTLHVAAHTLDAVPAHGTREVLVIAHSLFTTDPGDIDDTIRLLQRLRVRVSIVGTGAAVHAYHRVATATGGTYTVAMNAEHLRSAIASNVEPARVTDQPLIAAGAAAAAPAVGGGRKWVQMGFPARLVFDSPADDAASAETTAGAGAGAGAKGKGASLDSSSGVHLCACHLTPVTEAHRCPRCGALVCELPSECPVCSLALASAPHLARSYHHLYPLPRFEDVTDSSVTAAAAAVVAAAAITTAAGSAPAATEVKSEPSQDGPSKSAASSPSDSSSSSPSPSSQGSSPAAETGGLVARAPCYACARPLEAARGDLITRCPACCCLFCGHCDELVHVAMHNCPGCLARAQGAPSSDDDDDDSEDDGQKQERRNAGEKRARMGD